MQFITHMMTSISICIIILFILTSCNFALWSDIFAWNIFSNGCAAYSYIRSQSTNYFVSSGLLLPLPYDFDMAFDRGWHFIQGWLFIKLMTEHWFGNCSDDLIFYILSRKNFHKMDCLGIECVSFWSTIIYSLPTQYDRHFVNQESYALWVIHILHRKWERYSKAS